MTSFRQHVQSPPYRYSRFLNLNLSPHEYESSIPMSRNLIELKDVIPAYIKGRSATNIKETSDTQFINFSYGTTHTFNLVVRDCVVTKDLYTDEHGKLKLIFQVEDQTQMVNLLALGALDMKTLDAMGNLNFDCSRVADFTFNPIAFGGDEKYISVNLKIGKNATKIWDAVKGEEKNVNQKDWNKLLKVGAVVSFILQPSLWMNHSKKNYGWTFGVDTVKITASSGTARVAVKVGTIGKTPWKMLKKELMFELYRFHYDLHMYMNK